MPVGGGPPPPVPPSSPFFQMASSSLKSFDLKVVFQKLLFFLEKNSVLALHEAKIDLKLPTNPC